MTTTRALHEEDNAGADQTCCTVPLEGALLMQQQMLKLARHTFSCPVRATLHCQEANRTALEQLAGHSARRGLHTVSEVASVYYRVYSPLLYAPLSCNPVALQMLARSAEGRESLRRRQARAGLTVLEGGRGHETGRS